MDARDFRGIGRPAQEALRRRALVLIEREGMTQGQAALAVGVHRQTVNIWHKRYRERGEDGLLDGRRVSPRRGRGALSADEAGRARAWIVGQTPDQLGLPFALWTGRAVRELVERRFGKRLGLSTVPLYLRRWGMTPQKPLVRARQRQPAAIAAWLERDYPAIARRARAAKAVIYWGDETGLSNQDQVGRTWAPKGRTPVVARTAKRATRSMIAAVSNRGLMRFMLYEKALDADRFIAFLRRLIKDAGRKVILIVDNLKVHKAGKVRAWVEGHRHEIELFYLPSYAPDHNPSEYLNNELKQKLRQQPQPDTKEELIDSARSVLRTIQRSPERVRAYFKPEPVRYAA
ncbi:MAG TPA: IS630 family transposase [Oryzihumus sp.]|nr:IS630 family transposase [Oryzihumus sp.]